MIKEIVDPYFRVKVDHNASSPKPDLGIWHGQHTCVAEGFTLDDKAPSNPGAAIIKHQLKVEHWGVLRKAFLSLHCAGFPHSVMCQITRHQDSAHLVQSGRYTGQRFIKVANGELPLESVFYFRPAGDYVDRSGKRYNYDYTDKAEDISTCLRACDLYRARIETGWSEEHARDFMPYNFRQNFSISGDLQSVFHWLDQRTKKDSQLEIQALARMVCDRLVEWSPVLGQWYIDNRYGKARLAP